MKRTIALGIAILMVGLVAPVSAESKPAPAIAHARWDHVQVGSVVGHGTRTDGACIYPPVSIVISMKDKPRELAVSTDERGCRLMVTAKSEGEIQEQNAAIVPVMLEEDSGGAADDGCPAANGAVKETLTVTRNDLVGGVQTTKTGTTKFFWDGTSVCIKLRAGGCGNDSTRWSITTCRFDGGQRSGTFVTSQGFGAYEDNFGSWDHELYDYVRADKDGFAECDGIWSPPSGAPLTMRSVCSFPQI